MDLRLRACRLITIDAVNSDAADAARRTVPASWTNGVTRSRAHPPVQMPG
ncbi:hypothetical protein P7H06_15600 [Paenibacillus larvae]|nr:hypothetical protein [Paenibacillus larvae]MDT2260646.1 hypothetical protein [Paenibacillus larvae]